MNNQHILNYDTQVWTDITDRHNEQQTKSKHLKMAIIILSKHHTNQRKKTNETNDISMCVYIYIYIYIYIYVPSKFYFRSKYIYLKQWFIIKYKMPLIIKYFLY